MHIKKGFCMALAILLFFSSISWAIESNNKNQDLFSELEGEYSENKAKISDPIEPVNRFFFKVNDKLYFYFLKPVAKGYSLVVPKNFRQGISNCFKNIRYPIRAINDILEFRFIRFLKETGRFVINTALGFGGLLDPASGVGALRAPPQKDTGLTLGEWGIGNGFYLVLPVFGPSTLRDAIGKVGDHFMDPITYIEPVYASAALKAEDKINNLSFHLGEYEDLKRSAIDPYISVRNAYIQYRNSQLKK